MKRFICASLFLYRLDFTLKNLLLNHKSSVTGANSLRKSHGSFACFKFLWEWGVQIFFKSWSEVHFFKIYPWPGSYNNAGHSYFDVDTVSFQIIIPGIWLFALIFNIPLYCHESWHTWQQPLLRGNLSWVVDEDDLSSDVDSFDRSVLDNNGLSVLQSRADFVVQTKWRPSTHLPTKG